MRLCESGPGTNTGISLLSCAENNARFAPTQPGGFEPRSSGTLVAEARAGQEGLAHLVRCSLSLCQQTRAAASALAGIINTSVEPRADGGRPLVTSQKEKHLLVASADGPVYRLRRWPAARRTVVAARTDRNARLGTCIAQIAPVRLQGRALTSGRWADAMGIALGRV